MLFISIIFVLNQISVCGPNLLSYGLARLKAKHNYDNALLAQMKQRLQKMQAVFDEEINPEIADAEEIQLRPVEPRNDRPRCQQCPVLDPGDLAWNCPILIKDIQCQTAVINYDGAECLTANATCLQLFPADADFAAYLTAIGHDLTYDKRILHVLQYNNDDESNESKEINDNFHVQSVHPGRGFTAHLTCNDYRRWIVTANDRRYDVEKLFCLTLHTDQLIHVRSLFPV